ncbi:MAG: methionyl-tRNA formyltransferase [Verrucomicrobiales bacterium]|nr:methionyl-tRNA formyltransferase [Verrucomicrobiales bacterium]
MPTVPTPRLSRLPDPSVPDSRLRVVFLGTPDLARTILTHLAASPNVTVVAAATQPDRPVGRGLQVTPTPVRQEAERLGIPVLQPKSARDPHFLESLRELAPDLIVVAAYGQILPQSLLDVPRLGCLNIHTSLLPRWRGAAPIQWALASGDRETGVTLMRMEAGLDTGPMVASARTPIADSDTGQTLHDRLALLGARLLVDSIPAYAGGKLPPQPQPADGVTYARKITRDDGRLDWTQSADVLWHRLRAFTPWPGAFCFVPGDPKAKLLKIHGATPATVPLQTSATPGTVVASGVDGITVACGSGALRLTEVQPEGGRRMPAVAFVAGHPLTRLE